MTQKQAKARAVNWAIMQTRGLGGLKTIPKNLRKHFEPKELENINYTVELIMHHADILLTALDALQENHKPERQALERL